MIGNIAWGNILPGAIAKGDSILSWEPFYCHTKTHCFILENAAAIGDDESPILCFGSLKSAATEVTTQPPKIISTNRHNSFAAPYNIKYITNI